LKAARTDLSRFVAWWETSRSRAFEPALVRHEDLRDWRGDRQRHDGAAPATINRGLASLRGYFAWATRQSLLPDDPALEVGIVPSPELSPRSLPREAVDALLRAARATPDPVLRSRDEALLALLVYAGLRVQEACDVQLRDVDLPAGTVIVRSGKAGKARRVPLHPDATRLLRRYVEAVRCPQGMPAVGSQEEREQLLVGIAANAPGRPLRPGIDQRAAQRTLSRLGHDAASALTAAAARTSDIAGAERLRELARRLESVTPHMLRHSLARRLLASGAQLPEVQRLLGHTRLETTVRYLTPSEDDLRDAIGRAGV
ncbi:MAG: tyrosine-type recombinase/integrase, partial [Chloroflexia bacterium]|nr:tyrosine-type recombinase/integrase [Chloroflexia bacterium]